MNGFIKLSKQIINTRYIKRIIIKNEKYTIHMYSNDFDGFVACGTGNINSKCTYFDFYKKDDEKDYKTIDDWIKKIDY